MTAAAHTPKRGLLLLLAHCTPDEGPRVPAHVRLREELGGDFARRLLRVLLPRRQDRSDDLVA
jgi:hypothetical protein